MIPSRIRALVLFLAVFACVNTILTLYFQSVFFGGAACSTPPCVALPTSLSLYLSISIPISVGSWTAFGIAVTVWRQTSSNAIRSSMLKAGFDRTVYDLMIKMRGSGSRLSILQTLTEAPRHRNEVAQMTGMDWKEVDRQVGLLEKYGFVEVETRAGPVKMYKLTEQGISLVKLMNEMAKSPPT